MLRFASKSTLKLMLIIMLLGIVIPTSAQPIEPVQFDQPMTNQVSTKPNILVFMIDDLDESTLSAMLNAGLLPNIKSLIIDQGIRFNNSFVTDAACCPSRASFLTGQYPHNHNVRNVAGLEGGYPAFHTQNGGSLNRPTLATWLSSQSYRTGYIGKYMNGYDAVAKPDGWNWWEVLKGQYSQAPGGYTYAQSTPFTPTTQPLITSNPQAYQPRYIQEAGLRFMQQPSSNPFFLVLAPTAPHVDGDFSSTDLTDPTTSLKWKERIRPDGYVSSSVPNTKGYTHADYIPYGCNALAAGCLRSLENNNLQDSSIPRSGAGAEVLAATIKPTSSIECGIHKPNWICNAKNPGTSYPYWAQTVSGQNNKGLKRLQLDRMESMLGIDIMVGKVLAQIPTNTVVVFTSDNGYMLGEHLLGNKLPAYERSIRVPLIIRTPTSSTGPRTNDKIALNIDLAPTILDYAGVKTWRDPYTYNQKTLKIDGRSLKLIIENSPPAIWRDWFIVEQRSVRDSSGNPTLSFWDVPDFTAIRTHITDTNYVTSGNQLLIKYTTQQFTHTSILSKTHEHYNMDSDPQQEINTFANGSSAQELSQINELQSAMNRLKGCKGEVCRYYDSIWPSMIEVPRYYNVTTPEQSPCKVETLYCVFTSRSFAPNATNPITPIESISAPDGYYYNFIGNSLSTTGSISQQVERYQNDYNPEPDPCDTIISDTLTTIITRTPCWFESRTHVELSTGYWVESIISEGRMFNYHNGTMIHSTLYGQPIRRLPGFTKYETMCNAVGISPNAPKCIIDTRTFFTDSVTNQLIESITINGRLYEIAPDNVTVIRNEDLRTNNKYKYGPCLYAPANTPCTFDSRAFTTINGVLVESINAYGRFFNYNYATGKRW